MLVNQAISRGPVCLLLEYWSKCTNLRDGGLFFLQENKLLLLENGEEVTGAWRGKHDRPIPAKQYEPMQRTDGAQFQPSHSL